VWIAWLVLSVLLAAIHVLTKPPVEPVKPVEPIAKRHLVGNADMMESRPELKEKILRLHESLDKI
jgi:hypothetical protein